MTDVTRRQFLGAAAVAIGAKVLASATEQTVAAEAPGPEGFEELLIGINAFLDGSEQSPYPNPGGALQLWEQWFNAIPPQNLDAVKEEIRTRYSFQVGEILKKLPAKIEERMFTTTTAGTLEPREAERVLTEFARTMAPLTFMDEVTGAIANTSRTAIAPILAPATKVMLDKITPEQRKRLPEGGNRFAIGQSLEVLTGKILDATLQSGGIQADDADDVLKDLGVLAHYGDPQPTLDAIDLIAKHPQIDHLGGGLHGLTSNLLTSETINTLRNVGSGSTKVSGIISRAVNTLQNAQLQGPQQDYRGILEALEGIGPLFEVANARSLGNTFGILEQMNERAKIESQDPKGPFRVFIDVAKSELRTRRAPASNPGMATPGQVEPTEP